MVFVRKLGESFDVRVTAVVARSVGYRLLGGLIARSGGGVKGGRPPLLYTGVGHADPPRRSAASSSSSARSSCSAEGTLWCHAALLLMNVVGCPFGVGRSRRWGCPGGMAPPT